MVSASSNLITQGKIELARCPHLLIDRTSILASSPQPACTVGQDPTVSGKKKIFHPASAPLSRWKNRDDPCFRSKCFCPDPILMLAQIVKSCLLRCTFPKVARVLAHDPANSCSCAASALMVWQVAQPAKRHPLLHLLRGRIARSGSWLLLF